MRPDSLALRFVAPALLLASVVPCVAAQCGSALLVEIAAPAVFDGFDPQQPLTARFWEAGQGGANRSEQGCVAGCRSLVGQACASATSCLAITGANWLNATCTSPGHLPTRTIFLVEQTTNSDGGRWAAIDLDHDSTDANLELDAKATQVCGSCASILSPLVGGIPKGELQQKPGIDPAVLTINVTWDAPSAAAQALSNGLPIVSSYSVFYRLHMGPPGPTTGDPTGWTWVPDRDVEGTAHGGYSTDLGAIVRVPVITGFDRVTFAIGLNFDGSGVPTSDANTIPSTVISDQSEAVLFPLERAP